MTVSRKPSIMSHMNQGLEFRVRSGGTAGESLAVVRTYVRIVVLNRQ